MLVEGVEEARPQLVAALADLDGHHGHAVGLAAAEAGNGGRAAR